ncbi:MAG: Ig-like domain-containing protein [Gemmatimonadota bacterium]|nr:Ig-like domain-containing protein [Gemmatimonadota bacterium]
MRRLISVLISLAALAACASQGFPPGGPEDKAPPKLVGVAPESGAVSVRPREVQLRFDEVLSERPSGAPELAQLILISPRDGAPRVDWHRSVLTVRPRRDFRPNTVYTITLLPGLADLRGNVRRERTRIIFSTGPSIPATHLFGVIFDWVAGKPAGNALIEAVSHPDSTVYLGLVDSLGRFDLPAIPPGNYSVRGYVDANNNRALDPREIYDSLSVTLRDTASLEMYAFVHDTVGPRVSGVEIRDSVTLRVTFDRALDPDQRPDTALFRLRAADSSSVPIRAALDARAVDKARADSAQRQADSVAAAQRDSSAVPLPRRLVRADSAGRVNAPVATRPIPVTDVLLLLGAPLRPSQSYRLQARDIRGLLHAVRSSDRVLTVPKAAPPPAPPVPKAPGRDSTRTPPQ